MWVASNFFYLVSFLSISTSTVSKSLHLLPTKKSQSLWWERSAWQLRLLNLRKKTNCMLYPLFFPHSFFLESLLPQYWYHSASYSYNISCKTIWKKTSGF
jgi:hypothetical protein